jgi:hypothetical protein
MTINASLSLGTTLAVVCSWQRNRALLWAISHGICSWLYVLYFALTRKNTERHRMETPTPTFRAERHRGR